MAEVIQGNLRVKYLNRHVGDRRARQIAVLKSFRQLDDQMRRRETHRLVA